MSPIEFPSVSGPLAFGDLDGDGDEGSYGLDSNGDVFEFLNEDRDPIPAFTRFDEDANPLGYLSNVLDWGFSRFPLSTSTTMVCKMSFMAFVTATFNTLETMAPFPILNSQQ